LRLAQGILCGAWALAFPFDWARQIVDDYQLAPVPKAPDWLLGAANVDGNIIPVVDLAKYLGTASMVGASSGAQAQQRLLIGGVSAKSATHDSSEAIALQFEGLPQQLSYEPKELTYASALPPRLRELCVGVASNSAGQEYLEIDAARLLASLSDALSQE
jgi:chemotaxis signal transduction protein